MSSEVVPISAMLRELRQRRGMTQLALAAHADVSAKHLSFIETGRSQPSRDMLMHLAESLQLPLRERNMLLNAGGFALAYSERPLGDPALTVVRQAIEVVLEGHKPFPAFAVDRHWTLLGSNGGFAPFLGNMNIDSALLRPPVNVLRLTLAPHGMGPHVANYRQWRSHVLDKLHAQLVRNGDAALAALYRELKVYPEPATARGGNGAFVSPPWHSLVVPFQLAIECGTLSFYSTTTIFGTPMEITLSEISIESFYPADAVTRDAFLGIAKNVASGPTLQRQGLAAGRSSSVQT
jgi:transcriptional regulator with XRE-family HTH domain